MTRTIERVGAAAGIGAIGAVGVAEAGAAIDAVCARERERVRPLVDDRLDEAGLDFLYETEPTWLTGEITRLLREELETAAVRGALPLTDDDRRAIASRIFATIEATWLD